MLRASFQPQNADSLFLLPFSVIDGMGSSVGRKWGTQSKIDVLFMPTDVHATGCMPLKCKDVQFYVCLMVPRARVELARLAALDFESSASTDSAIGAEVRMQRTGRGRIILDSPRIDKRTRREIIDAHPR